MNGQIKRNTAALVSIRRLVREKMPYANSAITFDLILALMSAYEANEELTIQELFFRSGHSSMGIRYHFNDLIKDEWIGISRDLQDQRIKRPYPTEKLLNSISELLEELQKLGITSANSSAPEYKSRVSG